MHATEGTNSGFRRKCVKVFAAEDASMIIFYRLVTRQAQFRYYQWICLTQYNILNFLYVFAFGTQCQINWKKIQMKFWSSKDVINISINYWKIGYCYVYNILYILFDIFIEVHRSLRKYLEHKLFPNYQVYDLTNYIYVPFENEHDSNILVYFTQNKWDCSY